MSIALAELPDDPEALRTLALRQQHQLDTQSKELEAQSSHIDAQAEELRLLREYIRLLKHHRFGRKSERLADGQLWIFDEAEAAARSLSTTLRHPWAGFSEHLLFVAPRVGAG